MDKQREAFEAWASARFVTGVIGFGLLDNGDYADIYTRFMFEAWQACAKQYESNLNDVFEAAVKAIKYVPYTKQYEREEIAINMVKQAMEQSE